MLMVARNAIGSRRNRREHGAAILTNEMNYYEHGRRLVSDGLRTSPFENGTRLPGRRLNAEGKIYRLRVYRYR